MDNDSSPASERLNKFLAFHQGISRREADTLIEQAKVTINGITANLGARVAPVDTVQIDGTPIIHRDAYTYIALHKPIGYVCSRKQQGDTPTIYSILPTAFHHLKPIGRLDKDSSGIILLSDDGDFAYKMTHPKFYKKKVYEVELDHDLEPLHQQMISDYGVELHDGTSKFSLERLSDDDRSRWRITMSEGRNRQIRRTFGALGYTVTDLHRTLFGNYSLGDIKSGDYKKINIS